VGAQLIVCVFHELGWLPRVEEEKEGGILAFGCRLEGAESLAHLLLAELAEEEVKLTRESVTGELIDEGAVLRVGVIGLDDLGGSHIAVLVSAIHRGVELTGGGGLSVASGLEVLAEDIALAPLLGLVGLVGVVQGFGGIRVPGVSEGAA
jgi:hypothetical protein